jgi:hypothetical protein
MQYIPGQAQSNLETDGVRRFTEEELRNIARVIAEGDTTIAALEAAVAELDAGVNVPVFRIELETQQSATTSTYTKVSFDTAIVDSHVGWDGTNKRYVGKRSGWYKFEWNLYFGASGTITSGFSAAAKNGVPSIGNIVGYGSNSYATHFSVGSGLVFLNGTTDYVELYGNVNATTPIIGGTGNRGLCALSCAWVRS